MNEMNPNLMEIEEQASAWLARRDRGLTPAEQDAFLEWIAAATSHSEAWARLAKTWKDLDQLSLWRPEHSALPNPDLLAPKPASRRWLAPLPMAIAAAVALAATSWVVIQRSFPFPTQKGPAAQASSSSSDVAPVRTASSTVARGYDRRVLEDGSVVELNEGAAVEIRYSGNDRRVWLVQGEAHFSVAKDPARPFIVRAGEVDIRAVGTAFNVRLASDAVDVLVIEGKVEVAPPSSPSGLHVQPAPVAVAGQRVRVSREGTPGVAQLSNATAAEMAQAMSWQPRRLEFSSIPLLSVVEEFNRNGTVHIEIADPELAAMSVGTSFRSENAEAFIRLLEASFEVEAVRDGDRIVLRRTQ